MTGRVIFLTQAEVDIDPAIPVPHWRLGAEGRARHARFARDPVLEHVVAIRASTERKAREGAEAVAQVRDLPVTHMAELGENDRSATGYLPPEPITRTEGQPFGGGGCWFATGRDLSGPPTEWSPI